MEMNDWKQHPTVPFTLFKDLVSTLVIYHSTLLIYVEWNMYDQLNI